MRGTTIRALALALAWGLASMTGAHAEGPRKFVALELFTSQGCSSCPPADHVLQAMADDPDLPAWVVPLAFHVPYWDYIGWPDPYAQKSFEGRQRRYGAALRLQQIYTPQLVVNGQAHRVGPHDRATMARILEVAAQPGPGTLRIAARRQGQGVRVEASIELEQDLGGYGGYDLVAAAYDHAPPTPVGRGENTGRALPNPWTVRAIGKLGHGEGTRGTVVAGSVELPLPEDAQGRDLGVAVLLQNVTNMKVAHAGRVAVPRTE